jgi:hypothetical protein
MQVSCFAASLFFFLQPSSTALLASGESASENAQVPPELMISEIFFFAAGASVFSS